MNLKRIISAILPLVMLVVFSSAEVSKKSVVIPSEKTFTLKVKIINLRNTKGRIQLDLYTNQSQYEARKGEWTEFLSKKDANDGVVTHTYYNVKPGVYGLALFDDENRNGKIDYGWLMPVEGFGFGDYYHTKWTTPHFNDFKFYLNGDKTVVMKVRYL